ncbi:MAG: hypothetical protein GY906_35215 [bacterium]|nr:hypothetical protein [bacterium]
MASNERAGLALAPAIAFVIVIVIEYGAEVAIADSEDRDRFRLQIQMQNQIQTSESAAGRGSEQPVDFSSGAWSHRVVHEWGRVVGIPAGVKGKPAQAPIVPTLDTGRNADWWGSHERPGGDHA